MARWSEEGVTGLIELLFGFATRHRSPWAWILVALWAAPFVYAAYRIRLEGGSDIFAIGCLGVAALPALIRFWHLLRGQPDERGG